MSTELENTVDKGKVSKRERNPGVLTAKGIKDRELFLQWYSIPAMLRMLTEQDLLKMGYDTSDPIFMKMLRIRHKGEFCKEFGVGVNQPAKWLSEPDFLTKVNELSTVNHVMKFRKDIDFAFTQKVLKHGDAHRMKLWKQLNEGWSEREEHVNVNLNMTPADLVAQIEARNAKIRGTA